MKGQKPKPAAFMGYVTSDDRYGRLTEFRERLSDEVRVQIGEEFSIFQDRKDIQWGENWKKRIEESLDEVTFLIPIITPSFFNSPYCRRELERFLEREKELKRDDLVLPIYYVDFPLLNDDEKQAGDELAQAIADHQYADWRDLRFEPFTSPQVGKTLARLAVQIRDALDRVQASEKPKVLKSAASVARRPYEEASIYRNYYYRALPSINMCNPRPAEDVSVPLPPDIESMIESTGHIPRPTAKTEPPIRVVDQMHRGDHLTITEAIEAADPGDRILVRPGLYHEGLVIDKPGLEIIGDGNLDDVVVQAADIHTLLFKTTMGRVTNLTLRQMGGVNWYGVDIAQGRLELEDCDITSQSLACVAIHGGADPRLRRNRIHDGKTGGVYVYNNGQGVLEDNEIFGNAFAGVEIKDDGNPTLRRNRIHDGKTGGVYVWGDGQGVLEDNEIFGNAFAGVEIKDGGNPTLRRNQIHDGEQGVSVHENGQGVLEDNDIFGNAFSGVEIKQGGNPTLRRNRIHDGKTGGVYVWGDGQGVLEDNEIFGNAFAGVEIKDGGNPTLRRNQIHDGEQGVSVHENGQGVLEDNDIFGNAFSGVEIKQGGNPTLRLNQIHDGKASGVFVWGDGQGVLEDNDIFGNAHAGVAIKQGGNPTLRRNRINKNGYEAVWVYDGGGGTIEDNDLSDNAKGAWDISADSEPNLIRARNTE